MSWRTTILASTTLVFLAAALAAAAAAEQKLYVLASAGDSVNVIDVASDRIVKSIPVGAHPHGIASPASQDVLWVTAEESNELVLVDLRKDEVAGRWPVGRRPNEIEVTADGRYVYVPSLGDGEYEVFDTVERKIVARIATDGFPHNTALSPDGRWVYLAPMDRGGVETDPERIRALGFPMSMNEKIYVVDASTREVVATVPLADAPRPIAVHPSGDRLFVNRDGLIGFEVIDLAARRVVATASFELTREEKATPSRAHGIVVTPDGREVWSTDINNRAVHAFDVTATQPREIARMATGNTPTWLTITPDGKTVYVANAGDDTVTVYDVAAKRQRATIQMPKGSSPKRCLVVDVPGRKAETPGR